MFIQQQKKATALKTEMENAKVNLELTTVRAGSDGIIDNMYISMGTPVTRNKPLFSFVNTNEWYIQANFNETDLRNVRVGDKAYIMLRTYYFDRIFHGRVVNTMWAADRKITDPRTQQQKIMSNISPEADSNRGSLKNNDDLTLESLVACKGKMLGGCPEHLASFFEWKHPNNLT